MKKKLRLNDVAKSKINRNLFLIIMALPAIYGIIRYVAINGYSILLAFSIKEPFKDGFTLDWFKLFWKDMQGNHIWDTSLLPERSYTVLHQNIPAYQTRTYMYLLNTHDSKEMK